MLLEDCLNDIVDALPEHKHNDEISLLYESNKVNMVAVQTPAGLTDRINKVRQVTSDQSDGNKKKDDRKSTMKRKQENSEQ